MKILVTGSNGLLGQKLTELLITDQSIKLIATARGKSVLSVSPGEFQALDISDPEEVRRVVSATKPDVIINTAAMTQVDQCETEREACWKANVTSVENLVKTCAENHVHLVHVSTDFVFDGSHGPLDETEKPNPVNYYGESKLAAEQAIQKSSIDWSIV